MTAFAIDSNILIYALGSGDPRNAVAQALLEKALACAPVIPLQVLAELFNVCRRKGIAPSNHVRARVSEWQMLARFPPTGFQDLHRASLLSETHRLQYFDALIVSVSLSAGCTVLLSEDMADGTRFEGLTIWNPFNAANVDQITALLN